MKLCEVYRIKRESLGLSQTALAELVGISGPTVSKFECGEKIGQAYFYMIKTAIDREIDKLPDEERLTLLTIVAALSLQDEDNWRKKQAGIHSLIRRASDLLLYMDKVNKNNES